jgi:hypothetical protein
VAGRPARYGDVEQHDDKAEGRGDGEERHLARLHRRPDPARRNGPERKHDRIPGDAGRGTEIAVGDVHGGLL